MIDILPKREKISFIVKNNKPLITFITLKNSTNNKMAFKVNKLL